MAYKMPDMIGKTLGEYQIVEQIGKGGMATIYKAYQPSLDRDVAIKMLPPYYSEQDDTFLARFRNEAQAVAKLRHQNILMVMSFGEQDGLAYIVMEYVEAGTLKERFQQPLSLPEAVTIINQVAEALDYAHGQGVVHRDIKPSNIMLSKPDWALLTDFGLARIVGGAQLTQSGLTVGTPAYMSPEQGSAGEVDHRTDIYSLGVMLYEMTVGELPYQAETPMAVVVKHIVDPLPLPRSKNPDLPETIQRIILKALAKDPAARYQSAGELARAFETAVREMDPDGQAAVPQPADTLRFEDDSEERQPAASAQKTQARTQERPSKGFNWTLAVVVAGVIIIGGLLIGGTVGGVALFRWLNTGSEPDSVAITTSTATAPASTVTPQPPPPTAANTQPPTDPARTPLPQTSPDPAAGEVLFQDDFSDPDSGWDRFTDKDGFTDYVDGAYHIAVQSDFYTRWTNPYLNFGDVRIEVDAVLFDGGEDNGFGIICSSTAIDHFFFAIISSDGFFAFRYNDDSELGWVGEGFTQSSAIHLDGQPNHIRLDCIGDTMTLYVNGEFVGEASGLDLAPGDVGLWAETFDDDFTEVQFDNFVVYTP